MASTVEFMSDGTRPQLPVKGRSADEVIADLAAKREGDVRWADGRAFGMIYHGGPGVDEVAERRPCCICTRTPSTPSPFLRWGRSSPR